MAGCCAGTGQWDWCLSSPSRSTQWTATPAGKSCCSWNGATTRTTSSKGWEPELCQCAAGHCPCCPCWRLSLLSLLALLTLLPAFAGGCGEAVPRRAGEVPDVWWAQEEAARVPQDHGQAVSHICHQLQSPVGGGGKGWAQPGLGC